MTKMTDSNRSIFQSAARFFSGTMLSRLSGLARDMSMAFAFGTTGAIANFLVAFRFAHLARRLLGEGSLQTAFIPHFEELRQEGKGRDIQFFKDLAAFLMIVLLSLIILAGGTVLAVTYYFNLSKESLELLNLTLLMLPSLFFICLYGLNTALLECEKYYFTPSVAPVAFNLIWIAASLMLWKTPVEQAVKWLSLAVIIGCIGQWLMTLPRTLKIIGSFRGMNPLSADVRRLIKPFLLANIGVAASQVNNALDPLFARFVDIEGPAWLWYAIRMQQLPLALFGIALSGALLPPLSRAAKQNNLTLYKQFLANALHKSALLMVPISIAIFCLAPSAVNLLYGRGDFGSASIIGTTWCLWGYALGLLPMTWVLLLAPACYALGNYSKPMQASLVSMGANLFLNTLFIMGFGWGPASVAFATSFASWINVLHLQKTLQIKLPFPALIPSLVGLAVALFFDPTAIKLIQNKPIAFAFNPSTQLLSFTIPAACFFLVTASFIFYKKRNYLIHLNS